MAYLSRRNRDSVTIKSAKIRTRSVSLPAAASFAANALCRSWAWRENCSAGETTESWLVSDCRDPGLDGISGGTTAVFVFGMCKGSGTGHPGEPTANLDCGGGVGNAFGGIAGEASIKAAWIWLGEKGGVGASGLLDEPGGLGVDPRDNVPGPNCTGVLCDDASVDLGVSVLFDLALLGVDLVIVG